MASCKHNQIFTQISAWFITKIAQPITPRRLLPSFSFLLHLFSWICPLFFISDPCCNEGFPLPFFATYSNAEGSLVVCFAFFVFLAVDFGLEVAPVVVFWDLDLVIVPLGLPHPCGAFLRSLMYTTVPEPLWCSKHGTNFQVFFLSYFSYFFYISFLFLIFSLISTQKSPDIIEESESTAKFTLEHNPRNIQYSSGSEVTDKSTYSVT